MSRRKQRQWKQYTAPIRLWALLIPFPLVHLTSLCLPTLFVGMFCVFYGGGDLSTNQGSKHWRWEVVCLCTIHRRVVLYTASIAAVFFYSCQLTHTVVLTTSLLSMHFFLGRFKHHPHIPPWGKIAWKHSSACLDLLILWTQTKSADMHTTLTQTHDQPARFIWMLPWAKKIAT
jgi:hypothetical protein